MLIVFFLSLTIVILDDAPIFRLADAFSLMPTVHQHKIYQSRSHRNAIYLQTDETKCTEDIIHNNTDAPTVCYHDESTEILTSAVLKIAYDGTHFRGWTGSGPQAWVATKDAPSHRNQTKRKQSRRSRTLQRKGSGYVKGSGSARTVEQALKMTLAKIYGNVSPNIIMIDSCSRTDAGVHATCSVVHFYCLSNTQKDFRDIMATNKTWSQLRPSSPTDSNFAPLPFDSDLSKLVFVLNRMLPPDVRVISSSPAPHVPENTPVRGAGLDGDVKSSGVSNLSFHPTLHCKGKTYTYQFSVGPVQDPLRSQYVWHLDGSSHRAVGMNGKKFCLKRALEAASVFVETVQPRNYSAFKSAFRGSERGRVQSPICTIWRCELIRESNEILPSWEQCQDGNANAYLKHGSRLSDSDGVSSNSFLYSSESSYNAANIGTYTVIIKGDRFLYKMVRNIVGAIVAAACGYLEVSDIRKSLNSMENGTDSMRRICAPARGLALCDVKFPQGIVFDWHSG